MEAASRRSGLTDFGDTSFAPPLQRLLDACVAEADLSLVGRLALRWDTQRFLTNLLRLRAEEKAAPAILRQPVGRPIFITGLPRSGTTFLHRLLLQDPANQAPLVWQTIYPYPTRPPTPSKPDDRQLRVARQLRAFERLAPEFRDLHPLFADSPQECSEITAHVFRSLRYDTTYRIPSYLAWLDADGHLEAYQFQKRFLQHLQHQGQGGRWVLKCPDHLFALDAIRAVFPDARLVFVHRDPVKVLLSVARLTEVLRQPFTRHLDPLEIGRQESNRWHAGTQCMMQAGDDAGLPEPILHLHYLDLISDPIRTVDSLYQHFGLTLTEETEARMARVLGSQPNGGYGPRSYRFEDHGLNAVAERNKFRDYMVHFGVQPEGMPARQSGSITAGTSSETSRSAAG
jgi:hypothetical protein